MMPEIDVRPWRVEDAGQLVPMIRECLEETVAVGADWAPTDRNVDMLLKLGLAWAAAGDPSLVVVAGDKLVAYTLWGRMPSDLDVVSKTCAAMGTYVAPEYRRKGVSQVIRSHAIALAKRAGYDRILGSTYDPGGHEATERVGFKVIGSLVERKL